VNGAGADLEGEKYVLLATDGGPNCNPILRCEADECTVNLDGKCDSGGNCCETSTGAPLGERCHDDADVPRGDLQLAMHNSHLRRGHPGTEVYTEYLDDFAWPSSATSGRHRVLRRPRRVGVEGLTATFQAISTQLERDGERAGRFPA
jgi:hypothetical protein